MFAMIVAYISEEKSGNSCLGPLKSGSAPGTTKM